MLPHDTRSKIENITRGTLIEGEGDNCTAARNVLYRSFAPSKTVKRDFESKAILKEKQAEILREYFSQNHTLLEFPSKDRYLTKGGEAFVYFDIDNRHVIKLNDAGYYATWQEFLDSVLLHNAIFPNCAYELLGFAFEENKLLSVLRQPFIRMEKRAELGDIRKFLEYNGFRHHRRNDYVHDLLGLILEDMHDENVIVNSDMLFFIDTVFYIIDPKED